MRLFDELRRRNVIRAAIAYVALAWLVIQVAETLLPVYGYSDAAMRNLVAVLAIGFLPALVLSWLFEWTPSGWRRESADPDEQAVPAGAHRVNYVIAGVLLAAVTMFAFDQLLTKEPVGDNSIAVLAFADLSATRDQEYLGEGVAEQILNLLADVDELRVISRSSAFSFKGSKLTLGEIAERLGVTYILEGSVRRQDAKLRITAQLIDARQDRHVWSETYDRVASDIFAVQDDVATAVVRHLNATLLRKLPTSVKVDQRVYDLTLQARYLLHRDSSGTDRAAEELLRQALAIDDSYVPALTETGRVDFRQWVHGEISDAELKSRRLALLERMEAVAPESAQVYFLRATIAWRDDSNLQAAADHIEQALQREPSDIDGLRMVTLFLMRLQRFDDAIRIARYVALRDPLCSPCVSNLAMAYRQSGRYDEAMAVMQEMLEWRAPSDNFFWNIGTIALMQGQPVAALEYFRQIGDESMRRFASIFALHDLGRRDEVARLLGGLSDPDLGVDVEGMARIHAWFGDSDAAFQWIDRYIAEQGSQVLADLDTSDYYDRIRADPRWRALLRKHGYDDEISSRVRFQLPPGTAGSGG